DLARRHVWAARVMGDIAGPADAAHIREHTDPTIRAWWIRLQADHAIDLTTKEFELLEFFLREPKIVHDRYRILEDVWGGEDVASNVLEVYVGYLRRKLGEPQLIQTVRGVGYALKET
ncbi:MAG: helix-turn-helix domain-containing protein, partial [Chloroflexi bacterium]|nr:helix-turn-helix domain-containing protein [Chloroflexota bacterium]